MVVNYICHSRTESAKKEGEIIRSEVKNVEDINFDRREIYSNWKASWVEGYL